ncbi:protein lethal(2)essential for life-like [Bombus pascuorum]|uniref:protein lethal(2)essential for life-like n=1 Tax=Bombus pascuorum TaxID=65598 RepID=UPI00298D90AC|nr:protein lethal(2)essential for life-like [Bombus pascuorum]
MPLIPMLFFNWWEDPDRPHRLWDQYFGTTVDADDFFNDLDPLNAEVLVYQNVTIEAKHDEKKNEHGWVSTQFVRKYIIPSQCDSN